MCQEVWVCTKGERIDSRIARSATVNGLPLDVLIAAPKCGSDMPDLAERRILTIFWLSVGRKVAEDPLSYEL